MWPIALMSMQRRRKRRRKRIYDNFSNISWGITSDYGRLFMEQYT